MISYITTYRPEKLISSADELIRRQDVQMLVMEGYNIQSILLVCSNKKKLNSRFIF